MDDLMDMEVESLSGSGEFEELLTQIEAAPDFGAGFEFGEGDESGFGAELDLADAESALDELEAESFEDFFGESLAAAEGGGIFFEFADLEAEMALAEADDGSLLGLLRANPGLRITLSF